MNGLLSRLGPSGQVVVGLILTFGTGLLLAAGLLWVVQLILPTPLTGIWRVGFTLVIFLVGAKYLGFPLFKRLLRDSQFR